MRDPTATLTMEMAPIDPTRDYELVLRAGLHRGSPPSAARVLVTVNGVRVGDVVTRALGSMDDYRLPVPVGVLQRRAPTEIRFSFAEPPAGGDPADTQFTLQTLELRPLRSKSGEVEFGEATFTGIRETSDE